MKRKRKQGRAHAPVADSLGEGGLMANIMHDPRERVAFLECLALDLSLVKLDSATFEKLVVGKDQTDVRARLENAWREVIARWQHPDFALDFMFQYHPMLHNQRPVDLVLSSDEGLASVLGLLARARFNSAA